MQVDTRVSFLTISFKQAFCFGGRPTDLAGLPAVNNLFAGVPVFNSILAGVLLLSS